MSNQPNAVIRPRIHSANKRPLEDILPLRTPISAHIDISSVCNYKCSFCFQADMEGMKSARDVFTQPGVICQVCAIGAVAHSYITNFNGFTLNNAIYVDSKTKQLVRIFGKDLLSVIEAVYEGWAFDKVYVSYSPYMFESQADVPMDIYNRSFKSQTIESIMKNIIRNNGKYNYNGILIG